MKLPRFPVTFKKMYVDKAANQPSGTLLLANESTTSSRGYVPHSDYFDFVNKDKPAIS
jgi:hypothetical protein